MSRDEIISTLGYVAGPRPSEHGERLGFGWNSEDTEEGIVDKKMAVFRDVAACSLDRAMVVEVSETSVSIYQTTRSYILKEFLNRGLEVHELSTLLAFYAVLQQSSCFLRHILIFHHTGVRIRLYVLYIYKSVLCLIKTYENFGERVRGTG
jgi:hypothetical protein